MLCQEPMLLHGYNMEAPAPPDTILARIQADIRSVRFSNVTDVGVVDPPISQVIISPGQPLFGYVRDDSFEIWIRRPFVRLRGRVFASAIGSQIVAGVYLEPQAFFVWAVFGLLSALGTVWFICWLLSLVPLSLMVFATVRKSKSRLAHSIQMAVAEHRLHLDSSALGGPPDITKKIIGPRSD
jgi:hypothetical protein